MPKAIVERAQWTNRWGFILAAMGSAVGLGNLWKFPYIVGQYGGGAFILVYLGCILIVGIPIFMAEVYIGKKAQSNTVDAYEVIHRPKTPWRFVGWAGGITAVIVISIVSLVGGWVLYFLFGSILGQVSNGGVGDSSAFLGALLGKPAMLLFWQFMFIFAVAAIVGAGVQKGIERWNKILMPMLAIILVVLLVRSFFLDGFSEALRFLFVFDFDKLSSEAVLEAMGHALFTLGVGIGAMMIYGSYMSAKQEIVSTTFAVALIDTIVALISALVILSIVFTFGYQPDSGPTLIFETLPTLFALMDGGYPFSIVFFLLVAFAAITSALSTMELLVSHQVEQKNRRRWPVTFAIAAVVFLLGSINALSFNVLGDIRIWDKSLFDFLNISVTSMLVPLCGLFIILFYGWILGEKAVKATLGERFASPASVFILLWTTRLITPAAILLIFFNL